MERQQESDNNARHLMWIGVITSMAFAIVFSLIVGFMINRVDDLAQSNKEIATALALQITKTAHDNCINSNENKEKVIEVWDFLFDLNPNPTPEQQSNIDAAREKIESVYKQVQCPEL